MQDNNKKKNICDILKFEGIMSGGFGIAPRIVMRDQRLSIESKAIYSYFQSFAGNRESAFPSRETILNDLGISKSRYYKYLNQLVELDYIRIEREETDGWKGRNIYVIVSNPESESVMPSKTRRKGMPADDQHTKETVNGKPHYQSKAIPKTIKKPESDRKASSSLGKVENKWSSLADQLKIDELFSKYPEDKSELNIIYSVIKDMIQSEEIKISGTVKRREAILDVVHQLTYKHIIFVLKNTQKHRKEIKNKKSWIQTCLINSIYENEEDLDAVIRNFAGKKEETKESSSLLKKRAQQQDREIIAQHPYLAQRDERLRRLLSQKARAVIQGSSQKDQLELDIETVTNEMRQYVATKNLRIKI